MKSGACLQQLRIALANCKQDGSPVDEYFGRLTKLWDGITECMNSKHCSCRKCECDLNTAKEKEAETLRVHDFLPGLDDATHGVIRSQICAISPLPDLDSVYQTISQNEILRSTTKPEPAVMSFTSQARPSNSFRSNPRPGNKDPNRQCTVCGRTGHEATGCFTIIGYPEWWEGNTKNRPTNRNLKPTNNNSNGHDRNTTPKANTTTVLNTNPKEIPANITITDADRLGLSGITDDQWNIVQKQINKGSTTYHLKGKSDDCIWILDTGATHHMT